MAKDPAGDPEEKPEEPGGPEGADNTGGPPDQDPGKRDSSVPPSLPLDRTPSQVFEEPAFDGGDATATFQVEEAGDVAGPRRGGIVSSVSRPLETQEKKLDPAKAAHNVALYLLAILAASIFLQYLTSTIVVFRFAPCADEKQVAAFKEVAVFVDRIFSSLLPVLAGLVGSAVTYYFAKQGGKATEGA
jgi:hypothetical protein